ncbi:MAG: hypothetical protein P4L35_01000, partial [Ignavibacteriaceae bacterium]|nr:hypothetical protein [Ignavibacteriaceae bacterium]
PDKVLQNFTRIIKNIPFPSLWYRELTDKSFYNSFLRLCEFNQKSVDLFAEDAELHEYYISRNIFEKVTKAGCSEYAIKKLLFILSTQFTEGKINSNKFGEILQANLIEKIKGTGEEVIPQGTEYFIAGLGSFGTGEMNFSSDIDLLFIVKDPALQFELQKPFQSLLLKLKKTLKPFETDSRLRPEGKSGQLVWDLISYENYLTNRARVWELQSLCKLKFIAGDKDLFNKFKKLVIKRISLENGENIRKEIKAMRKKLIPVGAMNQMKIINLKRATGGILDIEFSIQFLMLIKPKLFGMLLKSGPEERITKLIPEEKDIIGNYNYLKDIILRNQCIFSSSGYLFKENEKENITYKKDLHNILQTNNKLFNKIMGN